MPAAAPGPPGPPLGAFVTVSLVTFERPPARTGRTAPAIDGPADSSKRKGVIENAAIMFIAPSLAVAGETPPSAAAPPGVAARPCSAI